MTNILNKICEDKKLEIELSKKKMLIKLSSKTYIRSNNKKRF